MVKTTWCKHFDPGTRIYYYHDPLTQRTLWELPSGEYVRPFIILNRQSISPRKEIPVPFHVPPAPWKGFLEGDRQQEVVEEEENNMVDEVKQIAMEAFLSESGLSEFASKFLARGVRTVEHLSDPERLTETTLFEIGLSFEQIRTLRRDAVVISPHLPQSKRKSIVAASVAIHSNPASDETKEISSAIAPEEVKSEPVTLLAPTRESLSVLTPAVNTEAPAPVLEAGSIPAPRASHSAPSTQKSKEDDFFKAQADAKKVEAEAALAKLTPEQREAKEATENKAKAHDNLKTKHVLKTTGMFRAAGGNPLKAGGRGGGGGAGGRGGRGGGGTKVGTSYNKFVPAPPVVASLPEQPETPPPPPPASSTPASPPHVPATTPQPPSNPNPSSPSTENTQASATTKESEFFKAQADAKKVEAEAALAKLTPEQREAKELEEAKSKMHDDLKTKHVLKTTGMFRAPGGNPLKAGGRGGGGVGGVGGRGGRGGR